MLHIVGNISRPTSGPELVQDASQDSMLHIARHSSQAAGPLAQACSIRTLDPPAGARGPTVVFNIKCYNRLGIQKQVKNFKQF